MAAAAMTSRAMSLPGQSLVESSTVMAASRTALAVRIKNVLIYYLFLAVLENSACAGVARFRDVSRLYGGRASPGAAQHDT
jgi:hypothetical protein